MRMARLASTAILPHVKPGTKVDPQDYMLFPDDAHELPDDVPDQERAWMLKLNRTAGD